MQILAAKVTPERFVPHALHAATRDWPETNCYMDLWIEILSAFGAVPEAALGFTLAQDFEGDQFTFFKFPLEDLRSLFGLEVQELAIYDRVEDHTSVQLARGNLVLVEVDAFYLPDTRGVSYRSEHSKTTIAVLRIDRERRQIDYFHNAGLFSLSGDDYAGIFDPTGEAEGLPLFPYVEFVKIRRAPDHREMVATSQRLFEFHLQRAPQGNPVRAFAKVLPEAAAGVAERGPAFFHKYAFNTLRQLGANFELCAAHLDWLAAHDLPVPASAAAAARAISSGAKSFQFQLARAVTRRKTEILAEQLSPLADAWDDCLGVLRKTFAA